MKFRIGRTLPPAVSPLYLKDIVSGITGLFRGGKATIKFEEELKAYYHVKYCIPLSSGKAALAVILQALKKISPNRDEVLIPAFTCYSVPSAIVRAGLKVRLCDLAPGTFDFDYEQLSQIISTNNDRLLCVVPVHLFGYPAQVQRIKELIAEAPVFIVEDAAQAMGGEHDGNKLGIIGDVGFISLGRGKALSTIEGGVILTKCDEIARHLEKTVNAIDEYGIFELVTLLIYGLALFVLSRPFLFWLPKSLPFLRLGETIYDPNFKMRRMSSFQAGLARDWGTKLQGFRRFRAENVQAFFIRLRMIGFIPAMGNKHFVHDLIRLPLMTGSEEEREYILQASERKGLGITRSYPDSVDRIPELTASFSSHHFPVAKEYAEKLLTLPVHPYVTQKDRDSISNLLAKAKQL